MSEQLVCVVTGASRGIGLATAIALGRSGCDVALVSRDAKRGRAALDRVREAGSVGAELILADLASQREVHALAKSLRERYPRLHAIVHNAAVFTPVRLTTPDGFEMQFAVNHLAPFLLTYLLLDLLRASASARVVVVASQVERSGHIDFDDPMKTRHYDGLEAYQQSKLANVMFTYDLAERLSGSSLTVNALHPGVVRTALLEGIIATEQKVSQRSASRRAILAVRGVAGRVFRRLIRPAPAGEPDWAVTPEAAAAAIVELVMSPALDGVSGRFFKNGTPVATSEQSRDIALRRRLWDLSVQLTGIPATYT